MISTLLRVTNVTCLSLCRAQSNEILSSISHRADVSVKIDSQFCFIEHFRYPMVHLQYIGFLSYKNRVNIACLSV